MIKIISASGNFEREPLLASFGFKGGYVKELWQVIAVFESEAGYQGMGLGVQSVLWSDPQVFSNNGDLGGNNIMFLMTQYALKSALCLSFETPLDLLGQLLPQTYEYGRKITGNPQLRKTFALNALVAVDNAAWMLYCKENNITGFDEMVPHQFRPVFSYRHGKLSNIPLITYGTQLTDIKKSADEGTILFKIKIGSNPDKDGDPGKMLEWDKQRLFDIHALVKDKTTPYTQNNHVLYYLDANGRYDSKDRLLNFLEYAEKINALDRIILLEEPFSEDYRVDVSDIPVRLAADESAHSVADVLERIQMGYGAIALKPIAKTMSMSLRMAKAAYDKGIPCFCADLTVNPVMVDWNKNVAARLAPLPGMSIGVLESNGKQNYTNWDNMKSYHPFHDSRWIDTANGLFDLDDGFYDCSGGIFDMSEHYVSLVK